MSAGPAVEWKWSADELQWLLERRLELTSQGAVYAMGPTVYVPGWLVSSVRKRMAADLTPPATSPARTPGKRTGKSYPAAPVAEVIRRVLNEQPSRALRQQLYEGPEAVPGATTVLIDHILSQMHGKPLTETRRKRWVRQADRILTVGSVTLADVEERLNR